VRIWSPIFVEGFAGGAKPGAPEIMAVHAW
jgi:hypothetical protein